MPAWVRLAIRLLTFVPTLLHELAHAAASHPIADEVRLVDPLGSPTCEADWAEEAPGWAIAFAAYAPTLSGLLVALAGLVSAAAAGGVPLPADARGWLVVGVGAIWYGIYITPSPSDVATAQDGLDRQAAEVPADD